MTERSDESDEQRRIARATLPEGLRRETLAVRTYSARLLGAAPSLVLHGGGNTSANKKCRCR